MTQETQLSPLGEDISPKRWALAVTVGLVALAIIAWLAQDLAPLAEHWDVALMLLGLPGFVLIKRLLKTRTAVRELEVLLPEHLGRGPASFRQLVRHFEEYTPQELSMATRYLESEGVLGRVGPCLCLASKLEEVSP